MPNNRERKRPQPTKKQVLIQMMLCLAIFIFFSFFPSGSSNKKQATPAPVTSAQAVAQASGAQALTIDTINELKAALPEMQGEWKIYIQPNSGEYVLLSPDVEVSAETMTVQGYELGQSVKARVVDKDTLAALLYKVPAGGSAVVANADGSEVDTTTFAAVADMAHKAGFKDVKLAGK